MLNEETQVPDEALPVAELKDHLRLGSGFAEDDLQDSLLASFLRAAMAAIEGWTDKALISREFRLTLQDWKTPERQPFPIAPVLSVESVHFADAEGSITSPLTGWRLIKDMTEPLLVAVARPFAGIPSTGSVEIQFVGGYGPSFDDVPADLRQAVLLLAAHYYEYRDETALSEGCMPFVVTALLSRYRKIRMGMGA
jgi:uncharacterized phiE125 gp8 family phage protein